MSNSKIQDFVKLEGASLSMGQSLRTVCPVCNGGSNKETTFSVSRLNDGMGLAYNCYRSSCGAHGFVPTSGVLLHSTRDTSDDGLRPYHGEYRNLEFDDLAYFRKRFDLLNFPNFAIGWNERNEYVFQVRDPLGRIRGYLIRKNPWKPTEEKPYSVPRAYPEAIATGSKSKLLMHARGAAQSWYVRDHDHVVLVEDHVSALKVWQAGFTSVALIGTHMDEQKVREIAQFKPNEVIIALDKDATSTAFKHARKWGLAFNKFRVSMLEFDIKDTDPENITEVLGL